MRLGRLILFASLAPLIGLPALTAILTAAAANSANEPAHVAFVAPASDLASTTVSPERTSRQAVLALTVFADTPLRHSMWMIERPASAMISVRLRRHDQLRC